MPGRLDRNTVRKQITSIIEEKKTSLCNGQPTITHIANTFANYEVPNIRYYRVGENLFFLSDIGSDRNWGSVLPVGFVSVPPFFCNIVYQRYQCRLSVPCNKHQRYQCRFSVPCNKHQRFHCRFSVRM